MKRGFLWFFNLIMIAYVVAPIVIVVWMSFTPTMLFKVPLTDFSLRWYREALSYDAFVDAILLSLRLAALSAALAVALSFFAAYGLVRFWRRGTDLAMAIFMSPLTVPHVVFGIAALQFANAHGFYGSFTALMIAHVVIIAPFAIRTLHATLSTLAPELEWAAMSLGARRHTALLRITAPLAARGIAAAYLLSFLMSFSEVTVTIFMTGPAHQTLPVRIFNYVNDRIDPTVAAVSSMVILVTLLLMVALLALGGLRSVQK